MFSTHRGTRFEWGMLWMVSFAALILTVFNYSVQLNKAAAFTAQIHDVTVENATAMIAVRAGVDVLFEKSRDIQNQLGVQIGESSRGLSDRLYQLRSELDALSLSLSTIHEQLTGAVGKQGDNAKETLHHIELLRQDIARQNVSIDKLRESSKVDNLVEKGRRLLMVEVRVQNDQGGSGSGTLLSGKRVLTAAHVVEGTQTAQVYVPQEDGSFKCYSTNPILYDRSRDLALLQVLTKDELPHVEIMSSKDALALPLLSPVYVVGYPGKRGPYFTRGELTNKHTSEEIFSDAWMINANIFYGSSGGGCFDAVTERLIGVPVSMLGAGMSTCPFLATMIPAHRIREWLELNNVKIDGEAK